MLKDPVNKISNALLAILLIMPGPLLLVIYKITTPPFWLPPLRLAANTKDVANMVASYSFTMLGFFGCHYYDHFFR